MEEFELSGDVEGEIRVREKVQNKKRERERWRREREREMMCYVCQGLYTNMKVR